ncbi:MAG: indole-3-glycerol phosphate synthase TrpC [Actinobacteria bacterium]|nr:indole-3-glycerol phosphate synthase TrpC [Actinomycetota bacterium]
MGSRIEGLIASTRDAVEVRKRELPVAELEKLISGNRHEGKPFSEALVRPGLSVIAEHKRRSPSAGEIRAGSNVAEVVQAYERGGAAALSVLTEQQHFGGGLQDLDEARAATGLPILAKNFHLDPYQLFESAAHGADAILIVVASVNEERLRELYDEAHALDLDAIVEVHDEDELERALAIDADVIGINNRNLATFEIDVETTFRLLTDVPTGKTVVAESGISNMEQIERLEEAGVDAVLIGEALMRAPDLEEACRAFARLEDEPPQR